MDVEAREPVEDGRLPVSRDGSTPIFPLQLRVENCSLPEIKEFIEKNHYSHSVFGVTGRRFFAVTLDGRLVGAAIFGLPAGKGVVQKYDPFGLGLLELRRFVLKDGLPKNSASRVLGVMLRWLKKDGLTFVLSYADPAHGHVGAIYKAAGFEYLGKSSARRHIKWKGKTYPDRNVHQTKFPFHEELRAAIADGSAVWFKRPGKHIYLKRLA